MQSTQPGTQGTHSYVSEGTGCVCNGSFPYSSCSWVCTHLCSRPPHLNVLWCVPVLADVGAGIAVCACMAVGARVSVLLRLRAGAGLAEAGARQAVRLLDFRRLWRPPAHELNPVKDWTRS